MDLRKAFLRNANYEQNFFRLSELCKGKDPGPHDSPKNFMAKGSSKNCHGPHCGDKCGRPSEMLHH